MKWMYGTEEVPQDKKHLLDALVEDIKFYKEQKTKTKKGPNRLVVKKKSTTFHTHTRGTKNLGKKGNTPKSEDGS